MMPSLDSSLQVRLSSMEVDYTKFYLLTRTVWKLHIELDGGTIAKLGWLFHHSKKGISSWIGTPMELDLRKRNVKRGEMYKCVWIFSIIWILAILSGGLKRRARRATSSSTSSSRRQKDDVGWDRSLSLTPFRIPLSSGTPLQESCICAYARRTTLSESTHIHSMAWLAGRKG